MADAFTSFDSDAAAGADPTVGGAVPIQLPPEQQRHGTLWPTPAEMVSDHSAEGAPWLPTARDVPKDPPQGPLWRASHDGPQAEYSAQERTDPVSGQGIGAGALSALHDGTDGDPWDAGDWGPHSAQPVAWPKLNIGQPFTANQGSRESRHLRTDQWDPTGKQVLPADAPSAPHEIYGSQHDTTPRFTPFAPGVLVANVASGNQFPSRNPGYWGVQASVPNLAPRPQGAVTAQMPSDPYVADSVGTPAPVAAVDYGWEF
jgi:hypothetical protein